MPKRRTVAEIEAIDGAIMAALAEYEPQSVRHIFYVLTGKIPNLVPKTQSGYRVVQRRCVELRRNRLVPYQSISDGTRFRRGVQTFRSKDEALRHWAKSYRQDLWANTPRYVEIWCESDSVGGTVADIVNRYGLSLMVSRGFSSDTYIEQAASFLASCDIPCYLYYIGDWDPSGELIPVDIERKLRKFAREHYNSDVEIHFNRIAITPDQIESYNLQTKPAKKTTHAKKNWDGGTVEVEALPVRQLRAILDEAISLHIDSHELEMMRLVEMEEQRDLLTLAGIDGDVGGHLQ